MVLISEMRGNQIALSIYMKKSIKLITLVPPGYLSEVKARGRGGGIFIIFSL